MSKQPKKFVFGNSGFDYDLHQQSFSDRIMSWNTNAISLLVAYDNVAAGLSYRHKPDFSKGLENLSPG